VRAGTEPLWLPASECSEQERTSSATSPSTCAKLVPSSGPFEACRPRCGPWWSATLAAKQGLAFGMGALRKRRVGSRFLAACNMSVHLHAAQRTGRSTTYYVTSPLPDVPFHSHNYVVYVCASPALLTALREAG